MKNSYRSVMLMIKFQLSHADTTLSIKQLIKLLHLIFWYDEAQMVTFAEHDGFMTLLKILE